LPLLVVVCGPRAARAQVSFAAPTVYATEKAPLVMTTADFNGDGKLDLAVADGGSESVTVLLGTGNGTFQPPVSYNVGGGCALNYLSVGDFNNDGKPDLLTACLAGTALMVLPGKGDGTFGPAITTPLSQVMLTGNTVEGGTVNPAVADFDGDGSLDIVLLLGTLSGSSLNGGAAYLMRGQGDGTFQSPQPVAALAGMETISFATADFNGDGKPDLAALALVAKSKTANLVTALGRGDGTFSVVGTYSATLGLDLTAGDVNGDGAPDLVISGAHFGSSASSVTAGVAVYTGKGDGSFQLTGTYSLAFETLIMDLCLADVRGTGKPDIVAALWSNLQNGSTASGNGGIVLMEGNGDGTFQNAVNVTTPNSLGPTAIISGDFNGDGRPDLAFAEISVSTIPSISGSVSDLEEGFLATLESFPNGSAEVLLNTTPPSTFTNVNAAGFEQGSMAQDSIVTAFGIALASTTATASALTTSLGGVTVNVKDSTGTSRPADLFYVSPTQINYAMPTGTATGAAAITIANGASAVTITQPISSVLPGIFAANGIAAANVETFQNGQMTGASLAFETAANGQLVPLPIDVSSGQVYLLMYGTGIRHAASVTVNLEPQTGLPAAYAGAQGSFVGEDQINVLLPPSLQGAGVISVTLTADGQTSNAVQIQIM